ncbi:MAG TPA: hypothetical protein VEV44_09150 [Pseudoneobacillus sp.]|nr:hypothetical protein [Pseudoneobacillus sp.]
MEDQLKNIKEDIEESIFKDFQFGPEQRQAVFRRLKGHEYKEKPNLLKKIFHHRFRGVLTILAYCGMLTIITTILINYMNEPEQINPGHNGVVEQLDNPDKPIVEPPSNILDQGSILTESEYIDKTYSYKLSFPENWLNKVKIEKADNGLRFYMTGSDGITQDIVTINIEKVEERLKFFYEGGPDPSKDFARLNGYVFRYFLPLDLALTNEKDVTEFGKLSAEVPTVIKSFAFTDNKSGLIGETPNLFGFTPQYNPKYGFEVNTPNKWKNLFKVEQSEKDMKFLFEKGGGKPTEFLSIKFLTEEDWNNLKSTSNEEIEFTEIAKKDDIVFVAAITTTNHFEDSSLFYPYEMLRTEAKFVIESFQFLD